MYEFKFPDVGEGIAEGEIIKVLVKVGDEVTEDQPIAEIQTDKATVEIPSPVSGKVLRIPISAGATIKVGELLMSFETEGDVAPDDNPDPNKDNQTPPEKQKLTIRQSNPPNLRPPITNAPTDISFARPTKRQQQQPPTTPPEPKPPNIPINPRPSPHAPSTAKALATPSVRRYARERNVNLSTVRPTGPGGRVMKSDIDELLSNTQPLTRTPEPTASLPLPHSRMVTMKGIRKATADLVSKSYHTAVHVSIFEQIDVSSLAKLRKNLNEELEGKVHLTFLPFIIKALTRTLPDFPNLNASIHDELNQLELKARYNIGIAVDHKDELFVPVIRDADHLSIGQLAQNISELTQKIETNSVKMSDLKNGTFTITNYGAIGGLWGTPIINYPEVAILGLGRITKTPIVKDDKILPADILPLTLTFDHRACDGAYSTRFIIAIKRLLENPVSLLVS